jgi:signal transduction histidine kinase
MPRNTAIFGPTFRGEGVVRLDDVTTDPRYALNAPHHGVPEGHPRMRSYLAVPVISRSGQVHGGLFLGHGAAGVFTKREEELVVGICAQAAIALDNARLYQEVQQTVQARDDFLAAVAHDLRTPLTAIKGQSQLLQRRASGEGLERIRDGLKRIDTTVTRMADQINELLDVARLRLGQPLEMDLRRVDLCALAHEAAEQWRASTTRHHIAVAGPTDGGLVGLWDEARLARVMDNLIDNAVKYSPNGGTVTVTLAVEQTPGGPVAVVSVADQGVGIPDSEQDRIFERFQRASNVVGMIAGTGIGLAGSRRIVELLGGQISVTSREGKGSTFTVRLPITPAEKEEPRPALAAS